jgi:hypothetical protein
MFEIVIFIIFREIHVGGNSIATQKYLSQTLFIESSSQQIKKKKKKA